MCGLLALSESTVPVVQGLKTGMYYLRTKLDVVGSVDIVLE